MTLDIKELRCYTIVKQEGLLSQVLKWRSLAVVLVCAIAFGAGALSSSEDFMKKLPNYTRFRCAICHTTAEPVTGNAGLNSFGTAFHANGDKWDPSLADKDSDGDGYKNGLELGDEEGDGTASVPEERSNPGDALDQPSSIDPKTWSIIKRLFTD